MSETRRQNTLPSTTLINQLITILFIMQSPWSPPPWMKVPVNGVQAMDGSASPNGLIDSEFA